MEISKNLFNKYEINKKWFKKNPNSIHGILHEYRVLIHSYIIGIKEKANIESLCYASIFHDVRRYNDGFDIKHSDRAANWTKKNFTYLKNIDEIVNIIYYHTPADNKIPNITKEIKCFKDADALDRFRIGIFDRRFLRTKTSKKLVNFAMELYIITEKQKVKIKDPKENVILALKKLKKELNFIS